MKRASAGGVPLFLMSQWDEKAARDWGDGYNWANTTQEQYMRGEVRAFLKAAYAVDGGAKNG